MPHCVKNGWSAENAEVVLNVLQMDITIDKNTDGKVLRDYLKYDLGFSRGIITRLKGLKEGIVLNGERVTVRAVLHEGDCLSLACEDSASEVNPCITPSNTPIDVIYEDDNIVAVNKPCGMPTHPSFNHANDSLANAVVGYYARSGCPFVFRAVNRLDLDTGGIVLIAKNRLASHKLSLELRERGFGKCYIAVLDGIPSQKNGEIKNYIVRCGDSIITRRVSDIEDGDFAHTVYRTVAEKNGRAVVAAFPVTGRTHQLRVHFSHIGTPILGDGLYGDRNTAARLMLHALSLTFTLPGNSKRVTLTAPLPAEFSEFIENTNNLNPFLEISNEI